MPDSPEIWSFFSGAMGLDLGLEAAGLTPTLAVEKDRWCRRTIAANRPKLDLCPVGDVTRLSGADLRAHRQHEGEVFLMVGGPPCQSFSTGGKRAALSDPRGNLIYTYLRLIVEIQPRYFILENVASLLTAALRHRPIKDRPGEHWSLKKYSGKGMPSEEGKAPLEPDELSGSAIRQILSDLAQLDYRVNFAVLNSADYGAPQKRYRLIMLGARGRPAPTFLPPTHGTTRTGYTTVRDAIWDFRENPGPHSEYTPEMARFFALIPEGGNWRDLPPDLQQVALGPSYKAGGGKTGFFRRLAWDEPAPTVTGRMNRKASAMCHPSDIRPISVREAARLQGFPDHWEFKGSMSSQYLQVGNAVPTHLGRAVGASIVRHIADGEPENNEHWEAQLDRAIRTLRATARNKRSRGQVNRQVSLPLDSVVTVTASIAATK